MVQTKLIALLSVFAFGANALQVSNIKDCPSLTRRVGGPSGVTDLRPDDIKVIAGLGDSIMAGAFMMGVDESKTVDLGSFYEYRGESYATGGDSNAVTLGKFVQHYSPLVSGTSLGKRLVSTCSGPTCSGLLPILYEYSPLRDRLNAALSGSMAMNLDRQLDYLITRMKATIGLNFQSDWKLINLQIGSNDLCLSCSNTPFDLSAEAYGNYVSAAIERIRTNIPRTIVNLMGTFKVSGVYTVTEDGPAYCRPQNNDPSTILNRAMCSCFIGAESNRTSMDTLQEAYNAKLVEIHNHYKSQQSSTFAVTYHPNNLNIAGFPLEAFSNFDCFHPSQLNHQWVAKYTWNNLFATQAQREATLNFDVNETIYCPTNSDRIRIN
ncbi:hypothetical protein BJV82DRAFT_595202 [Fennellomyces sp. T-0311]|nr:hypothetical protein BJV82DRAFT_595202 [Fennellomyces sp. T-0311]